MQNHRTSSWLDALTTALGPVIWGSTYIVTTELLPPDRPFTAALLRTLPAGLLLVSWCRRWPAWGDWVGWRRLLVLSALNIGVFQALLFVAAYRVPWACWAWRRCCCRRGRGGTWWAWLRRWWAQCAWQRARSGRGAGGRTCRCWHSRAGSCWRAASCWRPWPGWSPRRCPRSRPRR